MSITDRINKLRKERNAVILAHNYQLPEVQDVADFTGDSLGLSRQAAKTDADIIVFCGVRFMAETAAILSPDKTVLLPDLLAGCPMADMITAEQLRQFKAKFPGSVVVCYVNSTAEVKAESDYCCTSSNAVAVVNAIPKNVKILFVPDCHLGQYVKETTDRDIELWPGYCPTHVRITAEDIKKAKAEHPAAVVLAHPECSEDVKPLADKLLSTGGMLKYAKAHNDREYIIVTEVGIIYSLAKKNPEKKFFSVNERAICPNMKLITLEKVLWSLENMQYKIVVSGDIAARARDALDRMLKIV